jgi:ferredoxin
MKVAVDWARCNACGLCREVCTESAVHPKYLEIRHLYEIDPERCTGCGDCLEYCPAPGALVQSD